MTRTTFWTHFALGFVGTVLVIALAVAATQAVIRHTADGQDALPIETERLEGGAPGRVYRFEVDGVPCIAWKHFSAGGLSCGWD